jgi:hypothetical protein
MDTNEKECIHGEFILMMKHYNDVYMDMLFSTSNDKIFKQVDILTSKMRKNIVRYKENAR